MTISWCGECFGSFDTLDEAIQILKEKGWTMSKPPKSLYFVFPGAEDIAVIVMDDGRELKSILALPSVA